MPMMPAELRKLLESEFAEMLRSLKLETVTGQQRQDMLRAYMGGALVMARGLENRSAMWVTAKWATDAGILDSMPEPDQNLDRTNRGAVMEIYRCRYDLCVNDGGRFWIGQIWDVISGTLCREEVFHKSRYTFEHAQSETKISFRLMEGNNCREYCRRVGNEWLTTALRQAEHAQNQTKQLNSAKRKRLERMAQGSAKR